MIVDLIVYGIKVFRFLLFGEGGVACLAVQCCIVILY